MNLNKLCDLISLIDDDILQETECRVKKRNFPYKKIIAIAAGICFVIIISMTFLPMVISHNKMKTCCDNLPGASEIYPAVMYNGNIYYWKCMAGPVNKMPQGVLPDGYEYVGDINHINGKKLNQDSQFIAKFNAEGKLYSNKNDSDNVYICITTYWLEDAYVKFSRQMK